MNAVRLDQNHKRKVWEVSFVWENVCGIERPMHRAVSFMQELRSSHCAV